MYISAIGQDSHRFEPEGSGKALMLGGYLVRGHRGLAGNSDADVVLHALINAISGLHGVPILGAVADDLCLGQGVINSAVYLNKALELLCNHIIVHVSFSVEAAAPRLAPHVAEIRKSIAALISLPVQSVTMTATTGEKLTAFGRGEGIQVIAVVSACSK